MMSTTIQQPVYPTYSGISLATFYHPQIQMLGELRDISNYYFQLPITPAIQSQLHNSLINQQLQVISNGFQNLIMELQRILSYQEATWSNDQNADTHITTQAPSIISNYNSNENTTLPPNHTHLTLPQIIQLPQLQFTNETPNIIHRQRTQTLGKTVLDQKTITETASVPQKRKKGRNSVDPKKELICEHCQTTTTPEWRTGPSGPKTLCNRCGLRYAKYAKRDVKPASSPMVYIPPSTNNNLVQHQSDNNELNVVKLQSEQDLIATKQEESTNDDIKLVQPTN